jgi:hypothetical protein
MKLYLKDTNMMYREIRELLESNIGPAGPDTWQNGAEQHPDYVFVGFIKIHQDFPANCFIKLKW